MTEQADIAPQAPRAHLPPGKATMHKMTSPNAASLVASSTQEPSFFFAKTRPRIVGLCIVPYTKFRRHEAKLTAIVDDRHYLGIQADFATLQADVEDDVFPHSSQEI